MPLPGSGFLAIWNDLTPDGESDWLDWHTREHMPERVAVPGFLGGRRYIDWNREQHRLFTLYLGETAATFSSPPYLERLNNPTPWTTRTAAHFRNFLRGACHCPASVGTSLGGAILTIRVAMADRARITAPASKALLESLLEGRGLLAAHFGVQDASVSGVQTKEKALRGDKPVIEFEAVVLVEGETRRELMAKEAAILSRIASSGLGLTPQATGIYDLAIVVPKAAGA
jgi:hypothetical protein